MDAEEEEQVVNGLNDTLREINEALGDPTDRVIEECAELIVALQHWKRNRVGLAAIEEEMADVLFTIGRLMQHHQCESDVETRVNETAATLWCQHVRR